MKAEGRKKSDVADEIIACKKAFRRHRALDKNADAVLSQDALVDEIVAELQKPAGTRNANAPAPASRVAPPAEPAPRPEPKPEPDEDFNDIPPHLKRPFPGEARAT
jgi:hypothetical protein